MPIFRFIIILFGLVIVGFVANTLFWKITPSNFQPSDLEALLSNTDIPVYRYEINKIYPHDVNAFTEGMEINDGFLYESSGLYKQSYLRRIEKKTGKILLEYRLPPQYFAEGITVFKDQLYQLTYQSNIGFIYNKKNFDLIRTFPLPSSGWGMTHNEHELIMSNGTSELIFLNPTNLTMTHSVKVHYKHHPIANLNSLSFIDQKIYANIFETEIIAIISPVDGAVEGWINLSGLAPLSNNSNSQCARSGCVLNGIAYDSVEKDLLVTGKNWPFIYAINKKTL